MWGVISKDSTDCWFPPCRLVVTLMSGRNRRGPSDGNQGDDLDPT